ncbi:MAG: penicillin-binding protein 1C [Bacteroidales bacterium]
MNHTFLKKYWKLMLFTASVFLLSGLSAIPSFLFNRPTGTLVYSEDGVLLGARIADDGQWRFETNGEINPKYITSLIYFEDQWFRWHPGINPIAIIRAFGQNISAGRVVSGGSTISMQTIRLIEKAPRTVPQKIKEMFMAIGLELTHSKDDILRLYANNAPYGGNVVGIEAASWRWFGHKSADLSWGESALLAVLPNSPGLMHPGRRSPELKNKRDRLLKKLYEKQIISQTDYYASVDEPVPDKPRALPDMAPHLVAALHEEQRGKELHTTINSIIQNRAEERLQVWNNEFRQNGINHIAAIILDVKKNQVLAYCGNVNFSKPGYGNQVDIIKAPRSSGSILKPFLYCARLQEGEILQNTLLPDIPVNIQGFAPRNYNKDYDGAVPASKALSRSLNIPSVIMLRDYGIPKLRDLLYKTGMSTIRKSADHYGLSLILGGAEVTLWDVSSAYSSMAQTLNHYNEDETYHSSDWNKPQYLKTNGEVKDISDEHYSCYDAGAIWQTFEVLSEVNRPEEMDWHMMPSVRKVAWKTGTSYGFRDAWSVGVTPEYIVGVWVGNASGEGRPGLIGAATAAPVMFDLFNSLPQTSWFDTPYGALDQIEVCKESGHLKGRYCQESDTLFCCKTANNTLPCPYHIPVSVNSDESERIYADCNSQEMFKNISWFVLPPSWEWYYKNKHPEYRPLPPVSRKCIGRGSDSPMEFIYPTGTTSIILPKQLDSSEGKVSIEVAHQDPDMTLFWHLDGRFIGQTKTFHQMAIAAGRGKHRLVIIDQNGGTISRYITIE